MVTKTVVKPKTVLAKPKVDIERMRFNLDVRHLEELAVLAIGPYNSGKTYLMADFLKEQQKEGEVAYIDMAGEKGSLSAANFKLGDFGYRIENYTELKGVLAYLKGRKLAGVGLDSLPELVAILSKKVTGGDLWPDEPAKWNELHSTLKATIKELKATCPWVFCTTVAAIETDPEHKELTGMTIKYLAPDLPGKQARFIIGCFDMAGYLEVKKVGPKTTRAFIVDAPARLLVRQRLPNPITEKIQLGDGPGGWTAIRTRIQRALDEGGDKSE